MVLCLKEPELEDKLAAAGGVPESVTSALGSLLTSKDLDGMFIAAGISLPAATELIGDIPNIDPLLLHNVRWVILLLQQVKQTLIGLQWTEVDALVSTDGCSLSAQSDVQGINGCSGSMW